MDISPPTAPVLERAPTVVGWVEEVNVGGASFIAKLDTGAETCSIDASDIEIFERNAEKWVKCKLVNHQTLISYEGPCVDTTYIKRHGGPPIERPVIALDLSKFQLQYPRVHFTIVDRSSFIYRVLLGRNFLARAGWLVDSGAMFLHGGKEPSPEESGSTD